MGQGINPKHELHVGRRKFHDIPRDEFEEFDAILQNARKKLEPLVYAFPPTRHQREKLQCQKKAGGDP